MYWDLFPLSAETSQHNRGKGLKLGKSKKLPLHIIEQTRKPRRGTMVGPYCDRVYV